MAYFFWATLYTVIVPDIPSFLHFKRPSHSDRAKSKLEYCGATWLQKRLPPIGTQLRVYRPPPLIFHFNHSSHYFNNYWCAKVDTSLVFRFFRRYVWRTIYYDVCCKLYASIKTTGIDKGRYKRILIPSQISSQLVLTTLVTVVASFFSHNAVNHSCL